VNETHGLTTNEMKEFLYKPCISRVIVPIIALIFAIIDNHPACNREGIISAIASLLEDQGIWDLRVDHTISGYPLKAVSQPRN